MCNSTILPYKALLKFMVKNIKYEACEEEREELAEPHKWTLFSMNFNYRDEGTAYI